MELPSSIYNRIVVGILILSAVSFVHAQNLVPNYSFDTITECPESYGLPGLSLAPPWLAPTQGTPDLFNECATNWQFGVPVNYTGYQHALTGNGYIGMICHGFGNNFREYITAPLFQPLVADTWYDVSFYVNLANGRCGINQFGAYFSNFQPFQNNFNPLNFDPQVSAHQGFLNDTAGWELVSGCFQAAGGETFITLGNFYLDSETMIDPDCDEGLNYYYLENVTVVEGVEPEEIPLDLGGPETACYSYIIDPDVSGYNLLWEDMSTGPTLEVTESGTYSLTISDGCSFGIDSIEITIISSDEILDIGPPTFTLCDGETLTITLDPSLGDYEWQDGSNDTEYDITGPGTYSVTLDDGCSTTSDVIEVVELTSPPPFDLGDDHNICVGDEIDFSFDPSLGDFLWQDNNTNSNYTVSTGGTYSLTISNMCGMQTDEVTFTSLDIPDVQLGLDNDMICEGDVIDLELDPALGEILWPDGSDGPIFAISEPGQYIAYITNECGTGSDMVNVSLLDIPDFDLGGDTILCEGASLVLAAPGIDGDYMWQNNAQTDTFLVTAAGVYSLFVSNICGSGFDQITIGYDPVVAPVDFGPDLSLCPGEQITLYANNPNSTYLWQDGSTADSLLVNTAGTYSLEVTNNCSLEKDTIILTVNDNAPQIDLPPTTSLCQGQSITLDALITGVTYLWNDNSQNQQLLVNSPGTYSITVSNSCGTDVDTTVITDGGPAPVVDLGSDVQLCSGDNILLSPVFSNVDTWLWQDGSMVPTYNIINAGTIIVEVTNACGNSFDTLQATLLPATPPLDLGADTSLCSGESFILSINTPGVTIAWPDGSSNVNYNVSGPGMVYASITNSCGSSFDTIQVATLPDVPVLNLGIDQSLCPGEIISVSPGISNVQYLWQDGSNGNTYQSTIEETIILTISNICGTSTDTLEVIESTQGPQLDLGQDIQVCSGETVTIQSGISGVNYLWQDGSTNPDFITAQSGVFILEVNNNCGSASDTIVVDISGVPPEAVLPADTTLCEGISLLLTTTVDAETTIEWQDGSSDPTFTVTSAGVYSLSESNRCGNASDTITVAYLNTPDPFTIGADTALCPGETITLVAPTNEYTILWQDGSDEASFIVDQAGTYSLQLSNQCGSVSESLVFTYDTNVPQLNLDASIPWCEGDIITLDATQTFMAAYMWNTGATIPSIEITNPGLYSVEVSLPCSSTSQEVEVFPDTDCIIIDVHNEIYVPNVFSPNDDGINDLFALSVGSSLQITSMHGSIYDRWGSVVYSSEEIPFQWDGLFAGEEVLPGVYVYHIKCIYLEGGEEREKVFGGDVTVVR